MLILNEKNISPLLVKTIQEKNIPVFIPAGWSEHFASLGIQGVTEQEFIRHVQEGNRVLTNSENGLAVMQDCVPADRTTRWSGFFKDKAMVREWLTGLNPEFEFSVYPFAEVAKTKEPKMAYPFVMKPNVGSCSVGVHKIRNEADWLKAYAALEQDQQTLSDGALYDAKVLFEEWIEGEEFAVDGYYDEKGQAVVLNVFKRAFENEYDTSDRVYYTSAAIIREQHEAMRAFMNTLSSSFSFKNYPIHFEVRVQNGTFILIEVNPLRFAGAGTTDLGMHTHKVNMYDHYFQQQLPDWENVTDKMDDATYSFFYAELPADVEMSEIECIHHDALASYFPEILEYRQLPAEDDRGFALIFFKSEDASIHRTLLELDLHEFIKKSTIVKEG